MVLEITKISNDCIGVDLNRSCLRNISMLEFVIIQMLLWKFERYIFISLFPIRHLLIVEFDIEYKPIYFLFRAMYLISNGSLGLSWTVF